MDTKRTSISADDTLNDIVMRYPKALPILDAYGLDTCCGGGISLRETASRHGLSLDAIMKSLEEALGI
jgi:regulator of cell morphogenesis and NO signaling